MTNAPQKTLNSWKQVAAYLDRSERTVRRWETAEGLPIHRRGHEKQDTVVAYKHEIDAWSRLRTRGPTETTATACETASLGRPPVNSYLIEHDAITRTMHCYIAGARAGNAELMRPAFHPEATISGYCLGVEYNGSIEHVYDWINENGPAPNVEPRFVRIEIIATIAIVHLDVQGWSGKLAGGNARASDVFTLLKREGEWKITHKLFHWHDESEISRHYQKAFPTAKSKLIQPRGFKGHHHPVRGGKV